MSEMINNETNIKNENGGDDRKPLVPLTIRFDPDVYEAMQFMCDENNLSMAELCRRLLSRKVALNLNRICFIEPEDGIDIKRKVGRMEINYIGNNYNQDVKIRHEQVKRGLTPTWDPQNLGFELNALLDRCDTLAKEMGDALCTLR